MSVPAYTPHPCPRSLNDSLYDPIFDAPFLYGQSPPFSFLVQAFEMVANASGANSKATQKTILANLFRSIIVLRPDELVKTYYLCIGRLAPEYKGVETRLGKEIISTVVGKWKENTGNMEKRKELTIGDVYNGFMNIADIKGASSVSQREALLMELLTNSRGEEGKYIVKLAQRALKIGCSELTMESALAQAIALTPPQQTTFPPPVICSPTYAKDVKHLEKAFKRASNECPDPELVISSLLQYGPAGKTLSSLMDMRIAQPGVPVVSMLAQPCKSIEEIGKRMKGKITCEFKYDGIRAQIHMKPDGSVAIFSRNNEDITGMYPDIASLMQRNLGAVQDCILDCEVVAVDSMTGKVQSFQVLQHRRRGQVDIKTVTIPVCVYLFDLLYLNGKSTMSLPLHERRRLISTTIPLLPLQLQVVTYVDISAVEEVTGLVKESVNAGCEGLMVKSLDSVYEPAKRSFEWLKLKKDYMEENVGDSLDLVLIGASYGKVRGMQGRRKGLYGSFLLAVFDPATRKYQSVCRLGTGFSEDFLNSAFTALQSCVIPRPQSDYSAPTSDIDVWFRPNHVWEVKAADLTLSPEHQAALGRVAPAKGLALRFPRFLRVRPDKQPHEATTSDAVMALYAAQGQGASGPK